MMEVELIMLSKNKLGYKGVVNYTETQYKSIEHEGETYTKRIVIDKEKTIDDLRIEKSEYFYEDKYNFKELDYEMCIEEYRGFTRPLSNLLKNYCYSENPQVNTIIHAYKDGFLDDRIKDVYIDKTRYRHDWNEIMRTLEVPFILFDYGFNNSVYYTISIKTLLSLKIDKVSPYIIELFNKKGIDLTSNNTYNKVVKLINKKIDYETSK